jgi:hypothetical protein
MFSESSLVIADTEGDERFSNDPFLKDKGARFYAGAPLKAPDGEVIGSVCVLDTRPRQMTEQHMNILVSVANAVVMAIELHGIVSTAPLLLSSVQPLRHLFSFNHRWRLHQVLE